MTTKKKSVYEQHVTQGIDLTEVRRRAEIARPLVRAKGKLYHSTVKDLVGVAFTWNGTTDALGDPIPDDAAREVARFWSLHQFGAPSFFKPSVAEVVSQMDAMYFERKYYGLLWKDCEPLGFEVISPEAPLQFAHLLRDGTVAIKLGASAEGHMLDNIGSTETLHLATTVLYARAPVISDADKAAIDALPVGGYYGFRVARGELLQQGTLIVAVRQDSGGWRASSPHLKSRTAIGGAAGPFEAMEVIAEMISRERGEPDDNYRLADCRERVRQ